jgi:DNA-binding CsgD family transcriptional regulator
MSDAEDAEGWKQLADQLHERGGVAQRRAQVVALIATGHTQEETKEILGYSSRGSIANHIERYRKEDRPEAEWLLEHGPEV